MVVDAASGSRITDLLRADAAGADVLAVDLGDGQVTIAEVDRGSRQLAGELDALPGPPGLVLVRLPNCLPAVAAVLGVIRSRHALVMAHPDLRADISASVRPVAEVTLSGGRAQVRQPPYAPARLLWQPPAGRPDLAIGLCVLTSGTTGQPRIIAAPHRQVWSATHLIQARLGYRRTDVVAIVSPLSFDYGLYQLFLALAGGSTVVLDPRMASASAVLVAVARRGATVLPLVPTMLRTLTAPPLAGRVDGSRVRLVTTTGDLLTEADAAAAAIAFPRAAVVPMYGLSECKRVAVTPPGSARPPGAVGLPLDGTAVAALDASGSCLGPGDVGHLVVAGQHLTLGYLDDPAANAERFLVSRRNGQRLLHTGDRLRIDDAGWLYWVGRSSDMIKTSSYRIDPAEIETAAATSGVVVESGAYGRADVSRGQVPVLRIRLRQGVPPQEGQAAVKAAIERALPAWAQPELELTDLPLPTTARGKVDRAALAPQTLPAAAAATEQSDYGRWPTLPRSTNMISCHTQAVLSAFTLPPWVDGAIFELATTVPFGLRTAPDDPNRVLVPWFDPDAGIDRAAYVLGLRAETCWHEDDVSAFDHLDAWLRTGPVVLGPVDLGELPYHELAGTLRGSDHYLVVLGRDGGRFVVRDPEGQVEVDLDARALSRAWAAEAVPEGRGPFTMRRIVPGADQASMTQIVSRIASAAVTNLRAAARDDRGGASALGTLSTMDTDPTRRRSLSLLLPATAARLRLCGGFAEAAAAMLPDGERWRSLGELWVAQVTTLARAHRAVLTSANVDALLREAAAREAEIADTAASLPVTIQVPTPSVARPHARVP